MLGRKDKNFKSLVAVSLDDLVPEEYFYRQVEDYIDLEFVRDLHQGLYSPTSQKLERMPQSECSRQDQRSN